MERQSDRLEALVKKAMMAGESTPPSGAWARIEESLLVAARHRRIVMWRRVAGVAAVAAALITGYLMRNEGVFVQQEKYQVASNHTPNKKPLTTPGTMPGNSEDKTAEPLKSAIEQVTHGTSAPSKSSGASITSQSRSGVTDIKKADLPLTYLASVDSEDIFSPDLLPVTIPWIPVVLLPESRPGIAGDIPVTPKVRDKRWQMTGYAGRTFAGYYTSGTGGISNLSYREDMFETSQNQIMRPKSSMGFGIGFRVTNRFTMQTGAVYNQFSTTLSPGEPEITVLSNYKPASNIFGELSYSTALKDELDTYPILEVPSGDLVQRFGWLEVPLTGSYTLIKGPIGISVRAGFGGNFLTDNKVIRQSGEEKKYIGTTVGLQRIYLSALAGVDLYYEAGKSWVISFNPLYRQSLQPVSRGNEARPFLLNLGIYSGISYRF